MNGLRIPVFEKGNIVTADMLEAVKELSLDYQITRYAEYSNGILTGCSVEVNDTILVVREGILVYGGRLYYLTTPLAVPYYSTNEWVVLQLVIGNEESYRNVMEQQIEAVLTKEDSKLPNAMEVCRFRLQAGAILRTGYRDFKDQETEYDTINEIYADWSSYGETTISYRLLYYFAKEMGKKQIMEPVDYMFCQQIYQLNGESMNRQAIKTYLNQRLQQKKENYSNYEIYQKLAEIIRSSQGRGRLMQERQMPQRRIIVD